MTSKLLPVVDEGVYKENLIVLSLSNWVIILIMMRKKIKSSTGSILISVFSQIRNNREEYFPFWLSHGFNRRQYNVIDYTVNRQTSF